MIPMSLAAPFTKVFSSNKAVPTGGFPSKIPTKTEPTGDGIIELGPSITDGGQQTNDQLLVVPYGTDDVGEQYDIRAIGWRPIGKAPNVLWVPVVLAQVAVTLIAMTAVNGVAGTEVDENQIFSDVLSLTAGEAGNVSVVDMSAIADVIAHFRLLTRGFWKVEFTVDGSAYVAGTNNAASANALVAPLSTGAL